MSKEKIKEKINSELPMLRKRYHLKRIGLFGSVVKGKEKAESDIDILVELSSPIGFFDFVRLENSLSEMLGKKVDLVSNKALKKQIREEILEEVEYV